MISFKSIVNKVPIRLFLKVWPPFNEENENNIDISIGMVFSNNINCLLVISTEESDMITPCIYEEKLPDKLFQFSKLKSRMHKWMKGEEIGLFEYEYYEVTNESIFKNIVSNNIFKLQYIKLKDELDSVIGIKIIFEKDYIISSPLSDGNTIETISFNNHNNLKHFKHLGKVICQDV